MNYSHRFFLYAPVAAIVALAAAVSIYWFVVAHDFSKRLEALNGHNIAPGISFHYDSKSIGGFPFRVDAVLQNMRITINAPHGPAVWQTEHFALHMLDYGRLQLVLEAAGKQALIWHDAKGETRSIAFTPALLRASAIAHGDRISRFDIELFGADTKALSVAHTELHIRRAPHADALDIVFMADDVHLSPSLQAGLGGRIAKLRLGGRITPAREWSAFLSGKSDWRSAAGHWRTDSGAFDVARLEIDWGKTKTTGSGLLTLDATRRPKGLIHLKIAGYEALVRAAQQHSGTNLFSGLKAQAAQAGKTSGGPLPVTLAFKDGLAYAGHTPAGFLEPLY